MIFVSENVMFVVGYLCYIRKYDTELIRRLNSRMGGAAFYKTYEVPLSKYFLNENRFSCAIWLTYI
jgi:hypothetical protein